MASKSLIQILGVCPRRWAILMLAQQVRVAEVLAAVHLVVGDEEIRRLLLLLVTRVAGVSGPWPWRGGSSQANHFPCPGAGR